MTSEEKQRPTLITASTGVNGLSSLIINIYCVGVYMSAKASAYVPISFPERPLSFPVLFDKGDEGSGNVIAALRGHAHIGSLVGLRRNLTGILQYFLNS